MNAQLPLALRYPPDQRLETFVAAPDTLLAGAVAQVTMLADGRDPAGKLYLAGPAGSGKTHLLLAACAQADASGRTAAYLPLATAAGRLRQALESLDGYDLLALDGLEAVVGDRDDELALFALHNRAHDAGSAVLYAARAMPAALDAGLPDLRSRLSQCTCMVLDPLDDAGRRDVLRLRAERRGLQVDGAAFDWLLRRVGRDLSTLTALLDRLDRASLAAQRRVTVPFLRDVLGREDPLP